MPKLPLGRLPTVHHLFCTSRETRLAKRWVQSKRQHEDPDMRPRPAPFPRAHRCGFHTARTVKAQSRAESVRGGDLVPDRLALDRPGSGPRVPAALHIDHGWLQLHHFGFQNRQGPLQLRFRVPLAALWDLGGPHPGLVCHDRGGGHGVLASGGCRRHPELPDRSRRKEVHPPTRFRPRQLPILSHCSGGSRGREEMQFPSCRSVAGGHVHRVGLVHRARLPSIDAAPMCRTPRDPLLPRENR